MRFRVGLIALLIATTPPLFSQNIKDVGGGVPLVVGVGFSDFYSDWNGRLAGGTVWADWNFYNAPLLLNGFGIEVEARNLNYGRTGIVPNLRQDTAEGGPIYTWRHYPNFHPYGKMLFGFGSIDFQELAPGYSHDTRTVYAPGGGVEYRAWRNVWVRGDYQYQFWTDFFDHHAMNPNGFTIGASYDFRQIDAR